MHRALRDAYAKRDRALQHANELQGEVEAFLESQPYRIDVDFEPESAKHIARFNVIEEAPPRLSILVGEVAYACLSALNHLTWELASWVVPRSRLDKIRGQIEFPVCDGPENFHGRPLIKKGRVSNDAIAIMERLQTYHPDSVGLGRTKPLWVIKEIANADKHRMLAPVITPVYMGDISFYWDENRASLPDIEWLDPGLLEDSTEIGYIKFLGGNNAKASVDVDGQPSVDILFDAGGVRVRPEEIVDCITWLTFALGEFEPLFTDQD